MRLTPGQQLFGLDARVVRNGLRDLLDTTWDLDRLMITSGDLEYLFHATPKQAAHLLAELIGAGHITAVPDLDHRYAVAPSLERLAAASINNGIPRLEADRLVGLVLQKAIEIERNPDTYLYRVSRLAVFGSYLDDTPILGDIDLAFEVERVISRDRYDRQIHGGRDFYDARLKGLNRTRVALRLRRPEKISVHDFDEMLSLNATYRSLI